VIHYVLRSSSRSGPGLSSTKPCVDVSEPHSRSRLPAGRCSLQCSSRLVTGRGSENPWRRSQPAVRCRAYPHRHWARPDCTVKRPL